MKKVATLKENISKINKLSNRIPKTINEAINFEHDDLDMDMNDDLGPEPDMEPSPAEPEPMHTEVGASEKAKKLIDDIRKMALKAMAELADTPEDENYLILKKVWSMVDRKPEQDKNNNSNAQ